MRAVLVLLGVWSLTVVAPVAAAPSDAPFVWTEEYIPSTDGVSLHADVLRPAGLPADQRTPVIMTVSPYRSHTAYITTPRLEGGPSTENLPVDLFLQRGYTYVIVDLRGYGGSTGCPDFTGPGEQADVTHAVEWAAEQPWSTGRVGLYGVSYEGAAGAMGLATRPKGLAAVAIFAPVVDAYSYIYMSGISWRFFLQPLTNDGVIPADPGAALEHVTFSMTPGRPEDSERYRAAATSTPLGCYQDLVAHMQNPDPGDPFWRARDLIGAARGVEIPTFVGQGFFDANTRPYRVFDLWDALGPGEHLALFTQVGHRDCFSNCRATYADDISAFFDKHVAGLPVEVTAPRVTVGTPDGKYRSETQWPAADVHDVTVDLRTGSFLDPPALDSLEPYVWTLSQPLAEEQHLSGVATVRAKARGPANSTVAVALYDVTPEAKTTAITWGIAPVGPTGEAEIRLLAQDWRIPAGHRLGVRLSSTIPSVWAHPPTWATVSVEQATLELPVLTQRRQPDLGGVQSPLLVAALRNRTLGLDPSLLDTAAVTIDFPARTG
ncbi:CocE/NonD family hydrolase [Antrihabitans sp. YC2-6]|nr:CocE/NonD family hydrolase [Antrihabitans sp. YC2-6]